VLFQKKTIKINSGLSLLYLKQGGLEMNDGTKKILSIALLMLFLLNATMVIKEGVNPTSTAKADETEPQTYSTGLDFDYVWQVTENVSNAIHNAYHGNVFRKGRMFGSNGSENYAKNYTLDEMTNKGLSNVSDVQLGPLENFSWRDYTTFLNVSNFQIHINTSGYPYPPDVPKNESYAAPSVKPDYDATSKYDLTHNFSYSNLPVKYIPELTLINGNSSKVFHCRDVGNQEEICGQAVFITEEEQIPSDQDGLVFVLIETEQCLDKLNDVTEEAYGVILIHDVFGYSVDRSYLENFPVPIYRIDKILQDEPKINELIFLIQHSDLVWVNNEINHNRMVFANGYLQGWPNEDFYAIYEFGINLKHVTLNLHRLSLRWQQLGYSNKGHCRGVIVYSDKTDGSHMCYAYSINWTRYGIAYPGVPVFSVNNSVGMWIMNNTANGVRVSCWE
jgi:hypothetical protein